MEKMKNIKKFITIILIIVFTVIWYVGITVINSIDDKAEIELDSIVIIDNTDELNTFNGECLIQGKISSDNTVSYEVLSEECICVSKETQEYKSHYRNRTYTDSNGRTRTRRVLEYDWEKIDFENLNKHDEIYEKSRIYVNYKNRVDNITNYLNENIETKDFRNVLSKIEEVIDERRKI